MASATMATALAIQPPSAAPTTRPTMMRMGSTISVTASVGAASIPELYVHTGQDLLALADEALYQAKARATVAATMPDNGSADVDVDLETITVEFTEPMADVTDVSASGPWPMTPDTPHTWSQDGRTVTITRENPSEALLPFTVITIFLNAGGSGFEDLQGNPLGPYAFTFSTGGPGSDEPPEVQSTSPVDGERGVGVFREGFSVTFSKPMTFDFNMGKKQLGANRIYIGRHGIHPANSPFKMKLMTTG